jgi:hypothetical protein
MAQRTGDALTFSSSTRLGILLFRSGLKVMCLVGNRPEGADQVEQAFLVSIVPYNSIFLALLKIYHGDAGIVRHY